MQTNIETQSRESATPSANMRPSSDTGNSKPPQSSSARRPAPSSRQTVPALPAIFAAPPGVLMNAFLRNPWTFIRYMQDEMDRDFPTTSHTDASAARSADLGASLEGKSSWTPALEVFRRGSDMVVQAELPGLRTDDIDVSVQENALVISGERKHAPERTADGIYRSERRYGPFQRAVQLPEGVNEEQISASFSDGVLEVRVPVPELAEKTPRKIKIS